MVADRRATVGTRRNDGGAVTVRGGAMRSKAVGLVIQDGGGKTTSHGGAGRSVAGWVPGKENRGGGRILYGQEGIGWTPNGHVGRNLQQNDG